jgi:hypothetical protein
MFKKGSRYYNVPQSRHLTAAGEWPLSTELRFIARVQGQFLHTVKERERLDLLAYRYYNDPRKWWLVADANPELPFPLDLLDTTPVVEELLTLAHPDLLERVAKLVVALQSFGSTVEGQSDLFTTTVTTEYASGTTRALITGEIARLGFHLVDSNAWPAPAGTAEAFTFEDRGVKASWNALVRSLALLPGLIGVISASAGEVLRVRYNAAQLHRQTLEWQIENHGFVIEPQESRRVERVGAQITIPPNQA